MRGSRDRGIRLGSLFWRGGGVWVLWGGGMGMGMGMLKMGTTRQGTMMRDGEKTFNEWKHDRLPRAGKAEAETKSSNSIPKTRMNARSSSQGFGIRISWLREGIGGLELGLGGGRGIEVSVFGTLNREMGWKVYRADQ